SAEFRGARKAKRTMAMTTRNMPVRQDIRRPRTSAEASASTTGFGRRRGEALPGADFGALLLGLLGTMLLSSATGDRGRTSQHLQVCRVRARRARISTPWRVRFRPPTSSLPGQLAPRHAPLAALPPANDVSYSHSGIQHRG